MGELATAMRMVGGLPLVLDQHPSGRWSFTGGVPQELCYVKADGTSPSEEEFAEIRRACTPSLVMKRLGVTRRSWETREAAWEAAKAIGAIIRQVCPQKPGVWEYYDRAGNRLER